jgi:DNA-nicking Smr family endonuclease
MERLLSFYFTRTGALFMSIERENIVNSYVNVKVGNAAARPDVCKFLCAVAMGCHRRLSPDIVSLYDRCGCMMAEKRKEKSGADAGNRPFGELASLLKQAGVTLPPEEQVSQCPAPALQPLPVPEPETEDDQLFEWAMDGVVRIGRRDEPDVPPAPRAPSSANQALEEMRLMQAAASEDSAFPIPEHPEYIEGWVGIAGRRFLPNLRNGVYSIQGFVDLHGMSRVEAREAVEEFIERMSRGRSCCVKIVHGRGINSPSDKAVLKEQLQRWLATRRMARHVVAYASAPSSDGGVGAVYVLLRRRLYR